MGLLRSQTLRDSISSREPTSVARMGSRPRRNWPTEWSTSRSKSTRFVHFPAGVYSFVIGRGKGPLILLIRHRAVARAVLALSVLIIVGAWLGHQRGDLHLGVPIFDTLLFAWLSWTALPHAARSPAFR